MLKIFILVIPRFDLVTIYDIKLWLQWNSTILNLILLNSKKYWINNQINKNIYDILYVKMVSEA